MEVSWTPKTLNSQTIVTRPMCKRSWIARTWDRIRLSVWRRRWFHERSRDHSNHDTGRRSGGVRSEPDVPIAGRGRPERRGSEQSPGYWPEQSSTGTTAQFKATLELSDKSTRDVKAEVAWSSSRPESVFPSARGSVEGRARGEARLTALYSGVAGATEVMVLEEGTFRLSGSIREAGTTGYVSEARVETLSPPLVSVVTRAYGRYILYGVDANAELRLSKEGYASHVQRVSLAQPRSPRRGAAVSRHTRRLLRKVYAWDRCGDRKCHAHLPQEVWTRTDAAIATQHGSNLYRARPSALFEWPPQVTSHDTRIRYLYAEVDGNRAHMTLNMPGGPRYPDVIEYVSATAFFIPEGTVTLLKSDGPDLGDVGWLMGTWRQTGPVTFEPVVTCASARHQLLFSR